MRKISALLVLILVTVLSLSICYADSYDVRIQIKQYGPCQLTVVDTNGNIVLIYKPPDSIFSIKLASGEYFIYVEREEGGELYIGYSRIMIPQDTEIDIILNSVNALPREKANIEFYGDVQRIKIITLSGRTLFEILSPRVVEIPRIPLLIEISRKTETKYFFYDPTYSFNEFLKLIEENAIIVAAGEKSGRSTAAVFEVEKAEYQSYSELKKKELDIMGVVYWTSIVFSAALTIFIVARKIQFG